MLPCLFIKHIVFLIFTYTDEFLISRNTFSDIKYSFYDIRNSNSDIINHLIRTNRAYFLIFFDIRNSIFLYQKIIFWYQEINFLISENNEYFLILYIFVLACNSNYLNSVSFLSLSCHRRSSFILKWPSLEIFLLFGTLLRDNAFSRICNGTV